MKVKMLVSLSGPGGALEPGDIYDPPEDEAVRLISARYALPHVEDDLERAVVKPIRETRARGKRKA